MKYLISGQNGFIGKATTKYLVERSNEVIGIPRDLLFNPTELKDFIEAANPDYIIHLAAYGNHSNQQDELRTIATNIIGTYNLLHASKNVNYKIFYNISSSSVTLNHETFYSATKASAERIAKAHATKYNKNVINVKPYSVYGEGEADFRFIPTVIRHLESGKEMNLCEEAGHDWIWIEDFIKGMLEGRQFVGTGYSTSNINVVRILEEISRKKLKYIKVAGKEYDTPYWHSPHQLIEFTSLKEGLKKTYDYYVQR